MQYLSQQLIKCHHEEEGQLSIISLVIVLGFLVALSTLINTALVVNQKMEMQNVADSVSVAASTHMARGMNAITTSNHLIGEIQALIVLHHSLGGDMLDQGNTRDLTDPIIQRDFVVNYFLAKAATSGMPSSAATPRQVYDTCKEEIILEASIGESMHHLKKVLIHCYRIQILAGLIYNTLGRIPYLQLIFKPYAIALSFSSNVVQYKCLSERYILDAMELIAKTSLPLKKAIRHFPDALHGYNMYQEFNIRFVMEKSAEVVGSEHQVEGYLFPGLSKQTSFPLLELPVMSEPSEFPEEQLPRSQLVRTTTPWVHYWRFPMQRLGNDVLRLSHFKSYYTVETQKQILNQCKLAKNRGVNLYIMKDLDILKQEKGSERWTKSFGSSRADTLFCTLGLAFKDKPPALSAPFYFTNVNRDGIAAFAQSMIYNANPQKQLPKNQDCQVQVAWDTLNFLGNNVPEWQLGEDPKPRENTPLDYFEDRSPEPRIKVNWQTLMVPTTRLSECVLWQTKDVKKLLSRTKVDSGISRTH